MFRKAYQLASSFTRPVIISTRLFDGTVKCACAAFVILNEKGWILSAAHIMESFLTFQKDSREVDEYNKEVARLQGDEELTPKQRTKKLARLRGNPGWITNHSFWWGCDGVSITEVRFNREVDLFVGRLEPYDPSTVSFYPTFKDPASNLCPGTSLCRLGFPFHNIQASFDPDKGFLLAPGSIPVPRFPIEGIYTRNVSAGRTSDGIYEIKFLETSSPGLMGQSGGPIFDTDGTVWAIQSRTTHLPLGFSPTVERAGRRFEEHQFLNVGWGVHPEVIVAFLRDNSVEFRLSEN